MLRLDVERLKGELSAARVRQDAPGVMFTGTATRPKGTWSVGSAMPKEAVCGGPGRCGTLTCRHPGWGG